MYAKWEASSWAKKKAKKIKRANMTDFDRFKAREGVHFVKLFSTLQSVPTVPARTNCPHGLNFSMHE